MKRVVAAGVVALVLAGCSATAPETSPAVAPASTPPGSSNAAAGGTPGAGSAESIVGVWSSSSDATEFAYRFDADGRYRSVEIISQPVPRGVFEFRRVQDGDVEVVGERLLLRPTTSTTTRRDPGDPAGDHTDRPGPLDERTYTWRLDGATLSLRDDTGLQILLERQP